MKFATHFLIAGFLLCANFAKGDKFCEIWRQDVSNVGFTSSMYMLDKFHDFSRLMCANACESESQCESFFYNKLTRTCQLHKFVFPENRAFVDATLSNGSEYYRRNSSFVPCKGNNVTGLVDRYFIPTVEEDIWTRAFQTCQSEGGELASIPDLATIDALKVFVQSTLGSDLNACALWVSARVSKKHDNFLWFNNGATLERNSTLWYTNQPEYYLNPNNMATSNKTECVIMVPFYDYKLDDYACENGKTAAKLYPLCKCP